MSEFSRRFDTRALPAEPVTLSAEPGECAALAARFGLIAVDRLGATVTMIKTGAAVEVSGRIMAAIVQACAVSGEDLPVTIDEPLVLRFVPPAPPALPDEEIELDADACDEIEFEGTLFDLGEALAQTLALAIDPYAVGAEAEIARATLLARGAEGPFAALAALKPKD